MPSIESATLLSTPEKFALLTLQRAALQHTPLSQRWPKTPQDAARALFVQYLIANGTIVPGRD